MPTSCAIRVASACDQSGAAPAEHKYSPSGTYYAPTEGALTEYRRYVDRLPVVDSPEVFGMHVNTDVVSKVGKAAMHRQRRGMGHRRGGLGREVQGCSGLAQSSRCREGRQNL